MKIKQINPKCTQVNSNTVNYNKLINLFKNHISKNEKIIKTHHKSL